MDYIYKDSEIEFARYIKANPPQKIWWNFISYVFDYGNFYFQIESVSKIADTQNKSDEAIIGQFTRHLEAFVPNQDDKLICENKRIDELYIIRVFLYFTTFRKYSKVEQLFNQTRQKIKSLIIGRADPIEEILSKTIGGCKEVICHPKSDEIKRINPKHLNLIDCGLLLQIDGKILKAFVESNGFGFHIWGDKYFYDISELNEIAGQYEFIKV